MFLRNVWYIGAWSPEVTVKPMRRLIMNEPIVMYRCADGRAAMLEDRCSHRRFPLSKGVVTGDTIQCGYHGLTFDRKGTCVYAPGHDRPAPNSRIQIKAYPLDERDGIIWIWMGDPEKADCALIPDLSWLHEPGWRFWTGGYIHLKSQDQGLAENLLDISHLAYVHKSTMGSDPDLIAGGKTDVSVSDEGVRRTVVFENIPTPPVYRQSKLVKDKIDQLSLGHIRPGLYQNHVLIRNCGGPPPSADNLTDYPIQTRSFHGIVPETDVSTHYFNGGGFKDIDVQAITGGQAHQILLEDVDVLEAIQANELLVGHRPVVNLRNDAAVMRWRAFMKKASEAETAQAGIA
jgi:phenylpropionate dioxygenase-like ring-hydroxylating dioxygenase large terminal subunit